MKQSHTPSFPAPLHLVGSVWLPDFSLLTRPLKHWLENSGAHTLIYLILMNTPAVGTTIAQVLRERSGSTEIQGATQGRPAPNTGGRGESAGATTAECSHPPPPPTSASRCMLTKACNTGQEVCLEGRAGLSEGQRAYGICWLHKEAPCNKRCHLLLLSRYNVCMCACMCVSVSVSDECVCMCSLH